jgi:hypothetical protein
LRLGWPAAGGLVMDWRGGTPRTQELQRFGNPTLRSLMGHSRRQLPQVKVVRCRQAAGSSGGGDGASVGGPPVADPLAVRPPAAPPFSGGGGAGTGCRPLAEIGLSSSGRGGFFATCPAGRATNSSGPWPGPSLALSGPWMSIGSTVSSRAGGEAGNRWLSMLACSVCFPRLRLILTARPLVGMPAAGWMASPGGLGMARTSLTPPWRRADPPAVASVNGSVVAAAAPRRPLGVPGSRWPGPPRWRRTRSLP